MEKISKLLLNAQLLTMDENLSSFADGAIAVHNDHIVALGDSMDIQAGYTADEIIDCSGKVLMPGLINAHTHIPMTLLRGLADDLRLDVWLMGYMMPVERNFVSPDFVRLGSQIACAEMLRSGVTCFADMYYFEDEIAQTVAEIGMRAVCSQSVMKFPTPDARSFDESLKKAREFIIRWKDHELIVPSIAPHAVYTCTPEILKASMELALEYDIPLHTHISETSIEVDNLRQEYGMPVVPYMKKQNLFEAKVIAAHCVHIDEGEIRTLQHYSTGVAHNPSSNMKLASGMAPVQKMLEVGLNVGIGTDGPASNNDLDMFEEVRLASFLSKTATGDPTALPAHVALLMATRMGANALHIGDITGSLEPGKRADMILLDLRTLHCMPHFSRDPHSVYAQIVYSAKAADVTDVMVNGKWLMKDRSLLTINEGDLLRAGQEYAQKIDVFLKGREESVLSKLIAIGGTTEGESFEIQAKVVLNDKAAVLQNLGKSEIEILRKRHYKEYDTYFIFDGADEGVLRYREDHFVEENGEISNVRSRLTLIGSTVEHLFPEKVLLSRSRYIAPATQSLRFYREYFKPSNLLEIEKDRLRFLVKFEGTEFFVNIDDMNNPKLGCYLEVKSSTWSKNDADKKSKLAIKLIEFLGAKSLHVIPEDYFELVTKKSDD